jgi:tetratricopeptide (TPR) repeat protein
MFDRYRPLPVALLALAALAPAALAQSLTLPPSGDNQKTWLKQQVGPVTVEVVYSSPDVHAPDGTDRRGKVWGELVPYGWATDPFGTCGEKCPWRGGANENTVVRFSHDVRVEGQPVAAGDYGLFFVAGPEQWTVILSKNSTSWGHYFYSEAEDALRVQVRPEKSAYREWLTYEFTDRRPDRATLTMAWEELAVPIRIEVPDADELWYASLQRELRSSPGFDWNNWMQASQFLVQRKLHLDVAEAWARKAVADPFNGRENFQSLSNLAQTLEAAGKAAEAETTMQRAVEHPTATIFDLHQAGRQLIGLGRPERALAVFRLNAERHPDEWPVHVGLARGYAAVGDARKALRHAKLALAQAPDDVNRESLRRMVERLEAGDTKVN